ncbi:MAG: DUF4407 domain-containing protein, partial [Verrucomicrobiae bacterium]|nr:DUF4407 domain-containing protein [Verrucomicrobiae bacterium]
VWAFIILTIDRALLSTYRSYQGITRKLSQFSIRIVVAALMGITISHPLTLLLFRDTIVSEIERERAAELEQVRQEFSAKKADVEGRISGVEDQIASRRDEWQKTFEAQFVGEVVQNTENAAGKTRPPEVQARLDQKLGEATGAFRASLEAAENEIADLQPEYAKIQTELGFWQAEFEREVNGQRSGIVGLGPRARSIQDDQLAWRRDEAKRLGDSLAYLTTVRNDLATAKKAAEEQVTAEFVAIAAEKSERLKAERERIADLKRQVQSAQAEQFVEQQNGIRSTISAQIDTRLEEMSRLQGEVAAIGTDEQERIGAIKAEPRRDILTQTLALHRLFNAGQEGGQFALIAYGVLALLFMLVDTIPLIVKFFSKPGPYDTLVDCEEVRFDTERQAFLKSYDRYMEELAGSRLLHLSPHNKPLERALIEGVDRSRAAKEFMEHLLDLERAFEERVSEERAQLAEKAGEKSARSRAAILEQIAETFYGDLRDRMASFFDGDAARAAAAKGWA